MDPSTSIHHNFIETPVIFGRLQYEPPTPHTDPHPLKSKAVFNLSKDIPGSEHGDLVIFIQLWIDGWTRIRYKSGDHHTPESCILRILNFPVETIMNGKSSFPLSIFSKKFQRKILSRITQDLEFLENHPMILMIGNQKRRVWVRLVSVLGDDIGLRKLAGLMGTGANRRCRFSTNLKTNFAFHDDRFVSPRRLRDSIKTFELIQRATFNPDNAQARELNKLGVLPAAKFSFFWRLTYFRKDFFRRFPADSLHFWYIGILKTLFEWIAPILSQATAKTINDRILRLRPQECAVPLRGTKEIFTTGRVPGFITNLTGAGMKQLIGITDLLLPLIPDEDIRDLLQKTHLLDEAIRSPYQTQEIIDVMNVRISEWKSKLIAVFPAHSYGKPNFSARTLNCSSRSSQI